MSNKQTMVFTKEDSFLSCCMECTRGLAVRTLSVPLSNAWIVTKRKKDWSRFLYRRKDDLP